MAEASGTVRTRDTVEIYAAEDVDSLKKEQAQILLRLTEIRKLCDEQKRQPTDLEGAEFQNAEEELPRIKNEIERLEREASLAAMGSFLDAADRQVQEMARPKTQEYGRVARISGMTERATRDPRRGFRHMGDFSDAVHRAAFDQPDERFMRYEAAMTFGSGADGGFLMPPEFSQTIWNGMNMEPANLLAMCDNYPVTGESLTLLANGEVSRATGSRFGGIQGYWVEDGVPTTLSNPKVRRVRIEPRPLHVMVQVDNTLLRNPLAVERLLNMAAPEEIVFLVNDAIINGNGAGKPLGILQSAGRVTIAAEGGQATATIVAANINKMWARLHLRSRQSAVWFINQDVDPQLEVLNAPGTSPAIPIFLPSNAQGWPTLTMMPNRMLKGRAITEIEQAMTLGTEGDIILADMMAYVAGTRGTLETAMSMHLYFDRNQSAFRFTFYVDGQPWVNQPLTPFHGTATISPFVTIATRP